MMVSVRLFLQSRLALIGCGLIVFFFATLSLCGSNSVTCLAVMGTDGLAATAWVAGACGLGATLVRRFAVDTDRTLFFATAGGMGLGIFSLTGLGLGLCGWLNHLVAIAFPALGLIVFIIDCGRRHQKLANRHSIQRWLRAPAGAQWLWLIPVASLAIASVAATIMPGVLWKPLDPHPYDVTSYHLLVPREWYECGRIIPLAHNVFSYFPFNVEMQFLLLMHAMGGPWAGMYACQFVCVGCSVLTILAIFGVCKNQQPAGTDSSSATFPAVIAAGFAAVVPWLIMLAGVAYVESGLMLYTALSIGWAQQAMRRPAQLIRSLMLSGLMAGFACGVKITAVPMLLMAVPTALAAVLWFSRPEKLNFRQMLIGQVGFIVSASVVLSPWLIRNCIWSGNPLFPLGMSMLGKDHFTDQQVTRFKIAHSPTPAQKTLGSRLNVFRTQVIQHWQFGFLFFPIALVAVAMGLRDRHTWMTLICGLFVLVVWIGFTHLLPRFLVMLIPIGAIAIGKMQWGRAWPAALVLVLLAAGLGWGWVVPMLDAQSDPPPFHDQPRVALMGMEDLGFIMPPELRDALNQHLQIGMIGDAQAFLYQIPMKQMHYRTVFNLQGGDPITAWVGSQAKANPDWFLVINPMEIDRLHRTYFDVPAAPADWAAFAPENCYVRGTAGPEKFSPDE